MAARKPVKRFPLPEALPSPRGGKWDIQDRPVQGTIGGACSPGKRRMSIPTGPTPQESNIRKHELLHAGFSPAQPLEDPDADPGLVQVSEDARIQMIGAWLKIDWEKGGFDDPAGLEVIIKRAAARNALESDQRELLKLVIARYGTPEHNRLRNDIKRRRNRVLRDKIDKIGGLLARHLGSHYLTYNDNPNVVSRALDFLKDPTITIKLAKELTKFLAPPPEPEPKSVANQGQPGGEPKEGKLTPAEQETKARRIRKAVKELMSHGQKPSQYDQRKNPNIPMWGDMKIQSPPLTQPLRVKLGGPQWRPSVEGSGVRYPYRWAADRTIFAAQRRKLGGTVVIDCSGSMRLTPTDVLKILLAAPAATVACYSGHFWGDKTGGTLRILAKNGRRVADNLVCAPDGGENVIDGKVLRWLAGQKGPRVWISDGRVTGAEGGGSKAHYDDCAAVCKAARILRIDTPELVGDVIAYIQRRRVS